MAGQELPESGLRQQAIHLVELGHLGAQLHLHGAEGVRQER